MDHRQAGRHWEANSAAWTRLARQGFDIYRDAVNTPGFLELLPPIDGLTGLDVGCGEGHNTRLLARRGARMFGIDIAPSFARFAAQMEAEGCGRVCYAAASALELPFDDGQFDFATAFMSLMDLPDPAGALQEIHRVVRRGGFLQFSIMHPCFFPAHRRLLRDSNGEAYAVEVGRYFDRTDGEIERWLFSAAPPEAKAGVAPFEVPMFRRTLSEWLNAIAAAEFVLEAAGEPSASAETIRRVPAMQDTQVVAYFLHLRCRKPVTGPESRRSAGC